MIDLMIQVRKSIKEDKEEKPRLHSKAISLGLHPQPWWNNDTYKHYIERQKKEND